MMTTRWLRISSVIALLFALGHTLGGLKDWSPTADNEVLKAMRAVHFTVEGASRSYLDFYRGFGYSLSVYQLMVAALLWQLSTMARTHIAATRPMIALVTLAAGVCGVIAYEMILPLPAVFSAVLFASLVVTFVVAARDTNSPLTHADSARV